MPSERMLLEMGNRLLDFSAADEDEFLKNYNIKWNNAILQENRHFPMHDELASKNNPEYISGGASEDTNKNAQWLLKFPSSGYIGKEKKKNFKEEGVTVHFDEDKTAPIGTCAMSVVDGKSSFIPHFPAANNHKSDHKKRPKFWKLGFTNASRSSDLPSKNKLPAEDESRKRFLSGSRTFHGSQIVSETVKGSYFNRPLSPNLPSIKPQQSATHSISHQIIAVGVTSAVLLFPFVIKFSTLFDV